MSSYYICIYTSTMSFQLITGMSSSAHVDNRNVILFTIMYKILFGQDIAGKKRDEPDQDDDEAGKISRFMAFGKKLGIMK